MIDCLIYQVSEFSIINTALMVLHLEEEDCNRLARGQSDEWESWHNSDLQSYYYGTLQIVPIICILTSFVNINL